MKAHAPTPPTSPHPARTRRHPGHRSSRLGRAPETAQPVLARGQHGRGVGDDHDGTTAAPAATAPAPTRPTPPPAPVLPTGKGMWIWLPDQVEGGDANAIVAEPKRSGLTHLYVRTGSSVDGFYAAPFLDALLPVAHAARIKIIGWDFPYFYDIGGDISGQSAAITYTTPTGDRLDGFSPDIETPLRRRVADPRERNLVRRRSPRPRSVRATRSSPPSLGQVRRDRRTIRTRKSWPRSMRSRRWCTGSTHRRTKTRRRPSTSSRSSASPCYPSARRTTGASTAARREHRRQTRSAAFMNTRPRTVPRACRSGRGNTPATRCGRRSRTAPGRRRVRAEWAVSQHNAGNRRPGPPLTASSVSHSLVECVALRPCERRPRLAGYLPSVTSRPTSVVGW